MRKIISIVYNIIASFVRTVSSNCGETTIPEDVVELFAKHFLPKIQKHFQDPEDQKAFLEWKREREESDQKLS